MLMLGDGWTGARRFLLVNSHSTILQHITASSAKSCCIATSRVHAHKTDSKCSIQRVSPTQCHGAANVHIRMPSPRPKRSKIDSRALRVLSLAERKTHLQRTAPLRQSTAPPHRTTSDHKLTNPHLASPPASSLPSHHPTPTDRARKAGGGARFFIKNL